MQTIIHELQNFGIKNPELVELFIPGSSDKAFVVNVDGTNRYELWHHFRHLKEKTGLYPLLTASWSGGSVPWKKCIESEDFFMRFPFEGEEDDISPDAIINRSLTANYQQILEAHNEVYSEELVDQMTYSIDHIRYSYGIAPLQQDVLTEMKSGRIKDYFQLHKWLFDWQIQHVGIEQMSKRDSSYLDWYEPQQQVEALVLLPIKNGYEALAYIHWYGAESISSEVAIAVLKKWNEVYGAELVAHYGTMLHINVNRVPVNVSQAFGLAMEQEAFAPCTTALPGAILSDLAIALLHRKNWFLHERP